MEEKSKKPNNRSMKKIVVIGPESTGKSTLCEKLANHYRTNWCPEYAREYLLAHGTDYTYDSLLMIAKGQVALEEKCIKETEQHPPAAGSSHPSSALLFIDTDMYVMQVWCKFVFGKVHSWILNQVEQRKYDLYLLCNVDLPWVKDELREYPDLARREKLYNIYKEIMIHQQVPWVDIHGNYEERLHRAIVAVDKLLNH
jgi:NadR type nicotinamide-nucleotide adenylyltransferase